MLRPLLFALLLLVLGCGGPTFVVQAYDGAPRPREAVVVLRVDGGEPVRVLLLDEQDVAAPVASDSRLHFELLPGPHTVTARSGDAYGAPAGTAAFVGEPGKVYRVIFVGSDPHVFEVDRGSDKPERDVTRSSTLGR